MLDKARIHIIPHQGPDGLQDAAAKVPVDRGWVLVATYPELIFKKWDGSIPQMEASFRGHVFSDDREVRWVREGATFRWWELFEDSHGEECEVRDQRNYCWGYYEQGFWEGRMPRPYPYPVYGAKAGERVYVLVREYLRVIPEGLTTVEALMDHLNRPLVRAWRMLAVGAGSDPLPKREEIDDAGQS